MKACLTPVALANLIRMLRTSYGGAFCIVEGGDDKKFYRRFIDEGACKILVSRGWEAAIEVLAILNEDEFSGVLAIIDADGRHIEDRAVEIDNLIVTDTHDLETELFGSQVAFRKSLIELGDEELCSRFEAQHGSIPDRIKEACKMLGYLRLLSASEGYFLTFRKLKYSEFVDDESLAADVPAMIKAVCDDSVRHDLDHAEIRSKLERMVDPKHDLLLLCRGHDLMGVFSLGLRRAIGKNNPAWIATELVESRFREAYEDREFVATRLFARVKEWELSNPPFRVWISMLDRLPVLVGVAGAAETAG